MKRHAKRKRWSLTKVPGRYGQTAILRIGALTMSAGYSPWTWAVEMDYKSVGWLLTAKRNVFHFRFDSKRY